MNREPTPVGTDTRELSATDFHSAVERSAEAIAVLDESVRHLYTNEAYARLYGYDSSADLEGRPWNLLYPPEETELLRSEGLPAMKRVGRWRDETIGRKSDGSLFAIELSLSRLEGGRTLCVARDISEHKRIRERLERMAYHDPLTELPNRRMLEEKARQLLALAQRGDHEVALLYLDLDGFKQINDTFGHAEGDRILKEVARRLDGFMREADIAARLGGDEFAVLLSELEGEAGALRAAERMSRRLEAPFEVAGRDVPVRASIGIALFPRHASSFDELLELADRTMYGERRSKEAGIRVHRPGAETFDPRSGGLVEDLRTDLERYRLVLHYQPIRELETGEIVGAEALVRWPHPRLGLLPAAKFVPIAEDSGLALRLDRWVLATAVLQAKSLLSSDFPGCLTVHLSDSSLRDPGLVSYVERTLEAVNGLEPNQLVLQVPARSTMRRSEEIPRLARSLKGTGAALAVNSFSSGHPSVAQLENFPADFLNLDRSLLATIGGDISDEGLLRSVIEFAHSREIRVCAKGVEREAQREWLRRAGCDYAQGYLVGWTAPAEELFRA